MRLNSGKALVNETQKIFNYRLSRAQQIIENIFCVMITCWRVFQKLIEAKRGKNERIKFAAVVPHNYLRHTNNTYYTPSRFIDSENSSRKIVPGQWRNVFDANTKSQAYSKFKLYKHSAQNERSSGKSLSNTEP